MAVLTILRALGVGLIIIGLAHAAPIAVAVAVAPASVGAYAFGGAAALLAGGGLAVIGAGRRRAGDLREALLFILLWWIIAPSFASIAFMASGSGAGDAYFESVSALTTTGAWLSEEAARSSPPGIIWRASLQWIGGLATLAFASAVLVRPIFVGIETVPPQFARREDNSYFTAIESAVRYLAPAYLVVTAAGAMLLAVAGAGPLASIATAMSLAASGGFIADPELAAAPTLAMAGALFPLLLVGGANFVVIAAVADPMRPRRADSETGAYVAIVLTLAVALFLFARGDASSQTGVTAASVAGPLLTAASLASTNGVAFGEVGNLPVALIAIVIGGSAVSTAGGLKVLRWLVLFRRVREEIGRLVSPRAVFGRAFVEEELGVWMHFIVFTFLLAALTLFGAAAGREFDMSAAAAVGALANAGPALSLVEGGAEGYAVFENGAARAALVVGMILGRIEAVAALALINISFWRS